MLVASLGLSLVLAGCGGESARDSARGPDITRQVTSDAQVLGQEIFVLADRTMDYIGSHQGRVPNSLRELGIDSLTPTTARWLTIIDKIPVIAVEYRRSSAKEVKTCWGTHEVLEQSSLRGEFTVTCRWPSGEEAEVVVQREVGR